MKDKIFYDDNVTYFNLYKQVLEENEKLRERITYPKIQLHTQNECFGKKLIWLEMLLGDGFTKYRTFSEYEAFLDDKKEFKEHLINDLLHKMSYEHFKKAFEYWQKKERDL